MQRLDDGVSVSELMEIPLGGAHRDVSHYVRKLAKLDKVALKGYQCLSHRQGIPMLPPQLSNQICSLNAGQDRLALSCIMDVNPEGQVFNYEIHKSLIKVKERMTYRDVNKILAGEAEELKERYRDLIDQFFLMQELAEIIRKERMQRGMLDFDFSRVQSNVDDNGVPMEIRRREQGREKS
jgi:ribonuclease R